MLEEIQMGLRAIYRKLANKYGVSVEEVKRDMQSAIDEIYKDPMNTKRIKKLQDNILCKQEIPTVEEFVNCIAEKVKREESNLRKNMYIETRTDFVNDNLEKQEIGKNCFKCSIFTLYPLLVIHYYKKGSNIGYLSVLFAF